MRILILHGYSASNSGDGLLVERAVEIVREALGKDSSITLLARYPESFDLDEVEVIASRISSLTSLRRYVRVLKEMGSYEIIVGVGGGYMRFGSVVESVKTLLAHGPQVLRAGSFGDRVIYLPQSIGPFRFLPAWAGRRVLRRLGTVLLRDDRSMHEVRTANCVRLPDLAVIGSIPHNDEAREPNSVPVLSVRNLKGRIPDDVYDLARRVDVYDGFVQSRGAGNDDLDAVMRIRPQTILTTEEFHARSSQPRVVVAIRLHAALMALAAGHFVIHLAYERKGFGAFYDLGLHEYVHNVNDFDIEVVHKQINELIEEPVCRKLYREALRSTSNARSQKRSELVRIIGGIAQL